MPERTIRQTYGFLEDADQSTAHRKVMRVAPKIQMPPFEVVPTNFRYDVDMWLTWTTTVINTGSEPRRVINPSTGQRGWSGPGASLSNSGFVQRFDLYKHEPDAVLDPGEVRTRTVTRAEFVEENPFTYAFHPPRAMPVGMPWEIGVGTSLNITTMLGGADLKYPSDFDLNEDGTIDPDEWDAYLQDREQRLEDLIVIVSNAQLSVEVRWAWDDDSEEPNEALSFLERLRALNGIT